MKGTSLSMIRAISSYDTMKIFHENFNSPQLSYFEKKAIFFVVVFRSCGFHVKFFPTRLVSTYISRRRL